MGFELHWELWWIFTVSASTAAHPYFMYFPCLLLESKVLCNYDFMSFYADFPMNLFQWIWTPNVNCLFHIWTYQNHAKCMYTIHKYLFAFRENIMSAPIISISIHLNGKFSFDSENEFLILFIYVSAQVQLTK